MRFYYQKFWLRVLVFIPVIFMLAVSESIIIHKVGVDITDWQFYIISALIMFIFVYILFQYTGKIFLKEGMCKVEGENVIIRIGRKKIQITATDIVECDYQEIKIYGTRLVGLTIKYRTGRIKIYSEDLRDTKGKKCSLWKVYEVINDISKK